MPTPDPKVSSLRVGTRSVGDSYLQPGWALMVYTMGTPQDNIKNLNITSTSDID